MTQNIIASLGLIGLCFGASAHAKTYTYESSIKFGTIQRGANKATNFAARKFYKDISKAYRKACRRGNRSINSSYIVKGQVFNCKLNLEKLLKGQKQRLISATVPKVNFYHEGIKVTPRVPFKLKVDIEPIFKDYQTKLLDWKRNENLKEEKDIPRNVYIKHTPSKGNLYTSVCSELPGVKVTTHLSTIKLKLVKKLWWRFHARAKVDIDVDLGSYSMDSAKMCGASKLSVARKELKKVANSGIKSALSQNSSQIFISNPKLSNLRYSGVRIKRVRARGSNFLTRIVMRLFRKKINKIMANVTRSINAEVSRGLASYVRAHNSNIQKGVYWKRLANSVVLPPQIKLTTDINTSIRESIKGTKGSTLNVGKEQITALCKSLMKKIESYDGLHFSADECANIIENIQVKPLARNRKSSERSCYSFNHFLTASPKILRGRRAIDKNNWWKNSCKISTQVKITPNRKYAELFECLDTGIRRKWSAKRFFTQCSDLYVANRFKIELDKAKELLSDRKIPEDLRRRAKKEIEKVVRFL